jgi:hypothetical protein
MKSAAASLASEGLHLRACRIALTAAPAVIAAALDGCLRRVARLVAVSCSNALLLLVPVHAAGLPEREVGQATAAPAKDAEKASPPAFSMQEFLDRLMAAESGGRLHKKNPRSTALGPFQFIDSTFLFVVSKHFASEVAGLTEQQILGLRTNLAFSRRAAGAYANDLISALEGNGLPATATNVRLAFLVGPVAAVRLLKAPPDRPLKRVLSADAIAANPYLAGATVAKLVRKAAADVSATAATRQLGPWKGVPASAEADLERESPGIQVALQDDPVAPAVALNGQPVAALVAVRAEPPATAAALQREPTGRPVAPNSGPRTTTPVDTTFDIKCDAGLASCRKWIALQERKAQQLLLNARRQ